MAARKRHKLTTIQVRNIAAPGRHSDGGGLYLYISKAGTKSWCYMWTRFGRRREMGLGSVLDVSLVKAREKAEACRQTVLAGEDPIYIRQKTEEPTFLKCAEQYIEAKKSGWKNQRHEAGWRLSLFTYAKPLHNHKVSQIQTPDILTILKPIWLSKYSTASTLRGRIEAVLDYAKAMEWRDGENPAIWRGNLKMLLPERPHRIIHFPAMAVDAMPNFMKDLKNREALSARLLEFIILTAARSNEAREATWDEFDLDKGLWTIPAERMKAGKEHCVPLSDRALKVIQKLSETPICGLVFPQARKRRPFSVNATRALLHRMDRADVTTHGFRSTFRDWAGDRTNVQREVIEAALAHGIKNKAEASYRRSDALGKRMKLMQSWANYCSDSPELKIVSLESRKA